MAMGKPKKHRQQPLFLVAADLPKTVAHPFYAKLNQVLAGWKFDEFVEGLCSKFYEETIGRPSLEPGKCHHAGSQRGDAQHRSERYPAELSGVSDGSGPGIWDRYADPGRVGEDRQKPEKQGEQ
jgi:hypothetical protein